MKTNRPWALHFNITDHSISLHTALNQKNLDEDKYLKWAGLHYQIPLLKKDYFQAHPQNPIELWNKVKSKAQWSSSLVPIDEWGETVYAGCLEPPQEPLSQKINIVYVLAPSQCLQSLWDSFQTEEKQKTFSDKREKEEEANQNSSSQNQEILSIKPIKKTASAKPKSQNLNIDHSQKTENALKLQETTEIKKASPPAENKINKPYLDSLSEDDQFAVEEASIIQKSQFILSQGMNKFLNIISSQPKQPPSKTKPKNTEKKDAIFEKAAAKNTQFKSKKKPAQETAHTPSNPSAKKSENKDSVQGAPRVSLKAPDIKIHDTNELQKNNLSLNHPNKTISQTQNLSSSPSAKKEPLSSLLEQENKTADKKDSELEKKKNQPSPLRQELEKTKKHVQSYILFICKNKNFIPYKWSHNLKPKNKYPVPIKQPSLFRVSYHSKQPYFGWIPPVVGNQEFFDNWSFDSLPEQAVFIPFLNNDQSKVLGGYLGVLNSSHSSLEFLKTISKAAEPLNKFYQDNSFIKEVS